jgi:hypothetical protein
MIWVKDQTGRFPTRPHYLAPELDNECEQLITGFLKTRHGRVDYPIKTDDVTVLIESLTEDLDLYSDLSGEDDRVEGVTDFTPGRRPKVRISRLLTENPRMANRLRTTLTHELGHVHLHTFLFEPPLSGNLFGDLSPRRSNKCGRETILHASQTDWMEWQAGYACGAFLMPATALAEAIRRFLQERDLSVARLGVNSPNGQALIQAIMSRFAVSRDAARVRLSQRGTLIDSAIGILPLAH